MVRCVARGFSRVVVVQCKTTNSPEACSNNSDGKRKECDQEASMSSCCCESGAKDLVVGPINPNAGVDAVLGVHVDSTARLSSTTTVFRDLLNT